jgi:hypothetical protein
VSTCSVSVAAYDDLAAADRDWSRVLDLERTGCWRVVDAAMVEVDDETVVEVHRWMPIDQVGGVAACAAVALMRPVSLRVGASAGGVGDQMLVTWSRGLSRASIQRLGGVVDRGRLIIVTVAERGSPSPLPWGSSTAAAAVDSTVTPDDVAWASLADRAGR